MVFQISLSAQNFHICAFYISLSKLGVFYFKCMKLLQCVNHALMKHQPIDKQEPEAFMQTHTYSTLMMRNKPKVKV